MSFVLQFLIIVGLGWLTYRQEMQMASLSELAADLTALKDQAAKAKAEVIAKIAALEEAIANGGGTTPEVDAALAALKTEVQGIDDLNADTTAPA